MNRSNHASVSIATSDYVAHNDDVIATDCNNEIVLLRVKSARCYGMNEIGAYIWRKLTRPMQVAELIQGLQLDLPAAPTESDSQVLEFLTHLNDEGLIVRVQPPA